MKTVYNAILLSIFIAGHNGYAQTKNAKNEAIQLIKIFTQYHVSSPAVDDRLSKIVFDQFLDALDPDRNYFTLDDLKLLRPFEQKIDDDLNTPSWNFLPVVLNYV